MSVDILRCCQILKQKTLEGTQLAFITWLLTQKSQTSIVCIQSSLRSGEIWPALRHLQTPSPHASNGIIFDRCICCIRNQCDGSTMHITRRKGVLASTSTILTAVLPTTPNDWDIIQICNVFAQSDQACRVLVSKLWHVEDLRQRGD